MSTKKSSLFLQRGFFFWSFTCFRQRFPQAFRPAALPVLPGGVSSASGSSDLLSPSSCGGISIFSLVIEMCLAGASITLG